MDVRLKIPPANWRRDESPELRRYLADFIEMRAGRVFDWSRKPLRWRAAMRHLSQVYFQFTEQTRQTQTRAAVALAHEWGAKV